MQKFPLDLATLKPKPAELRLSAFPEHVFRLCPWSLWVRSWATEKFGGLRLQQILQNMEIIPQSEIVYFMLSDEDKKLVPSLEFFQKSITTLEDQGSIVKSLMASVGIGEPELAEIQAVLNASAEMQAKAMQGGDTPKPTPNRKTRRAAKTTA